MCLVNLSLNSTIPSHFYSNMAAFYQQGLTNSCSHLTSSKERLNTQYFYHICTTFLESSPELYATTLISHKKTLEISPKVSTSLFVCQTSYDALLKDMKHCKANLTSQSIELKKLRNTYRTVNNMNNAY